MTTFTEAEVEQVTLDWLSGLGWGVAHGLDIASGTPNAERDDIPSPTSSRILRVLRDSDMLAVLSEARGRRPALLAFLRLLRVAEGSQ